MRSKRPITLGPYGGKRVKGKHAANGLKQRGTNRSYLLARLDRDNPALAARVRQGELSAYAAAVQEGFRKPRCIVPLEAVAAARILRRHFSEAEIAQLRAALLR
jgi:hypothetical protein